jgi:pimeloyl-ACP methyl ester carboxylesterase
VSRATATGSTRASTRGRNQRSSSCTASPTTSTCTTRLLPHLNPPRRVITFDFLGWGASDKPTRYPYTATNQTGDLDAVIEHLRLGSVVLVAHDASGPPAINWALEHPQRVAGLVLLNTYYCSMPGLRSPEAIWLFSTPLVHQVTRPGVAPVRRPGVLAHVPAPPIMGNTS